MCLILFICGFLLAFSSHVFADKPIHDPLNIFCGSLNCYDILGVSKDASIKDIKKAYRRLSLTMHPDKNKESNATEVFRSISKAFEVLSGNESRPLFDYYLKYPKDYFKVSGQHYIQNMPKSDVRVVLLAVIALISWLMHAMQSQRYERVVKRLSEATLNNLGPKNGGSKEITDLFKRAADLYDAHIKDCKASGDKSAGKIKMQKDPLFAKFVDKVVREVQIEGGSRKPTWQDLFAVQLVYLPYYLYLWAAKYHRRHISSKPLPVDDQLEMARDAVSAALWDEMGDVERTKLVAQQIWKPEVLFGWRAERQAVEESLKKSRQKKRARRKGAAAKDDGEDDDDNY